jgi:hypothetical protein
MVSCDYLLTWTSSDSACSKKCQDLRIPRSGELEIPETPENTTHVLENVTSKGQHETGHDAVPWFESGLVASVPKVRQKLVGQISPQQAITATKAAAEPQAMLRPSNALPTYQDTNGVPQMSVRKEVIADRLTEDGQSTTTKKTPNTGAQRLPLEMQNKQSSDGPHRSSQNLTSPSRKRHEELTHVPIPDWNSRSTSEFEPESPESDMSDSTSEDDSDQSSTTDRDTTGGALQEELSTQRDYTKRELARLALVSAKGSRMTSSQIVLWVAHTFPKYRVGKGGWEKSIYACLSKFPEFDGRKIAEAFETKKLYGFSNASYRTRYEKEYSGFFKASTSRSAEVQSQQDIAEQRSQGVLQSRRAVKSAPSHPIPIKKEPGVIATTDKHKPFARSGEAELDATSKLGTRRMRKQAAWSTAEGQRSRIKIKQMENDESPMSIKRPVSPQPTQTLDPELAVKRAATFKDARAAGVEPSIDSMTEAEKAQKIAEIKARPSRKKYFGSNHRLVHKRRYNLADIHDESDGAWKPLQSASDEPQRNLARNDDAETNEEDSRTLREVFDLPNNMIPMNDGYTELAFRDGTLVSFGIFVSEHPIYTNTKCRSTVDYHDHAMCTRSARCLVEN